MEKTNFYYLIRFTPTAKTNTLFWGDKVRYVWNARPYGRRASWNTTHSRSQAERFPSLSQAKRVFKTVGLANEHKHMEGDIVRVQEYEEFATIFPEPNVAEQLAQIELEA